jgi:hypothetical protein
MQVTFTLTAQATYELVLPATNDIIKVNAWLESKGASFDRYFRSNGTVKFVFITIPELLVCQIASKYSLIDETPVAGLSPARDYSEYRFVKAFDLSNEEYYMNGFWIDCPSPEAAVSLALEFSLFAYPSDRRVHFFSLEEESETMTPELLSLLIARFGEPAVRGRAKVVMGPLPDPEVPYFFADIYTDKEIKARYRQLSKIHHPDAGGSPEMFQALHEQYLLAIEPF